jgi:hypothetical protein
MRIALYIVPGLLFILWVILFLDDFRKLRELHQMTGLNHIRSLSQFKQHLDPMSDEKLKKIYRDLVKHRNKKFLIWILSCVIAVIILVLVGVATAK